MIEGLMNKWTKPTLMTASSFHPGISHHVSVQLLLALDPSNAVPEVFLRIFSQ